MTNIEQKALELVNEVAQDVRYEPDDFEEERRDVFKALCRAIERHEAFKEEVEDALLEFRQEVSNEMLEYSKWCQSVGLQFPLLLDRFIIPKPDPLQEILLEEYGHVSADADAFRAALAKRGLEIREKSK